MASSELSLFGLGDCKSYWKVFANWAIEFERHLPDREGLIKDASELLHRKCSIWAFCTVAQATPVFKISIICGWHHFFKFRVQH